MDIEYFTIVAPVGQTGIERLIPGKGRIGKPNPDIAIKQYRIGIEIQVALYGRIVPILVSILFGQIFSIDIYPREPIAVVHHNTGNGKVEQDKREHQSRPAVQLFENLPAFLHPISSGFTVC
jgi:hypothetical protein